MEDLKRSTQKDQKVARMHKIGKELIDLYPGKLDKHWPVFFQVYLNLYENIMNYNGRKSSLFVLGQRLRLSVEQRTTELW